MYEHCKADSISNSEVTGALPRVLVEAAARQPRQTRGNCQSIAKNHSHCLMTEADQSCPSPTAHPQRPLPSPHPQPPRTDIPPLVPDRPYADSYLLSAMSGHDVCPPHPDLGQGLLEGRGEPWLLRHLLSHLCRGSGGCLWSADFL